MEFDKALDFGVQTGKNLAYRRAEEAGASDIKILVEQNDRYAMLSVQSEVDGEDNPNKLFIESRIEISATGNPWAEIQYS